VWEFGFQCNERYLKWDESAQVQLLKLHCSDKLGWDMTRVLFCFNSGGQHVSSFHS
jgi:hypothetical protein